MIKVIHIITSLKRGGRERQLLTICKHSKEGGIQNKIFCFTEFPVGKTYLDEYPELEKDITYCRHKSNTGLVQRLRKLIGTEQPDILFTWGNKETIIAGLSACGSRTKILNGSIRHGIYSGSFDHWLRKCILHISGNIVANSKAGIKANGLKKGSVLYNGIDPSFIREINAAEKESLRNSLSLPVNKKISISVGNLIPYKDHTTIIEAYRRIHLHNPDIFHVIIGDGPMRNELQARIDQAGLHDDIILPGIKSNVADYLYAGDFLIHSSKGEGCSNAILEAMFAGLPVIATDTGGTPEILHEDFSRLFHYQEIDACEGLIYGFLLLEKEKLEEMGRLARIYAINNFSILSMIKSYQSIIKSLAQPAGKN